jgi:hypothetical protein
MIIRIYQEDIPTEVREKIKDFDFENILDWIPDPFNFDIGVVYDDNQEIIALGLIRAITEFKMVLNPEIPKRTKHRAINVLMEHAVKNSPCKEHLIMVTQGEEVFEKFLKRDFLFYRTNGIPLKLEV